MNVKEDFHHLIDTIEDQHLLVGYYQLIKQLSDQQNGKLWNSLSEEQKQELLVAYDESFDPANLISHEEVKKQHEKWLNHSLAQKGQ